jgi:hypothetical protein
MVFRDRIFFDSVGWFIKKSIGTYLDIVGKANFPKDLIDQLTNKGFNLDGKLSIRGEDDASGKEYEVDSFTKPDKLTIKYTLEVDLEKDKKDKKEKDEMHAQFHEYIDNLKSARNFLNKVEDIVPFLVSDTI